MPARGKRAAECHVARAFSTHAKHNNNPFHIVNCISRMALWHKSRVMRHNAVACLLCHIRVGSTTQASIERGLQAILCRKRAAQGGRCPARFLVFSPGWAETDTNGAPVRIFRRTEKGTPTFARGYRADITGGGLRGDICGTNDAHGYI